jgi:2-polyprenyl-3-methyl-5-hydroxy-6-metoxy-1,4-benzoquinol methylase
MEFLPPAGCRPLVQSHGLLEVACGTGRLSLRLADLGLRVTGLDLSLEMIEKAMDKRGDGIEK